MYYTVLSNGFTVSANALQAYNSIINLKERRTAMWTTPTATELRFGMEITAYVMNK